MRVAVCQLNSREDRAAQPRRRSRPAGAGRRRAVPSLAVLPEYVDYLGPSADAPKPEPVDGEFGAFFADAARELGIWVHAGSFHETGPDDGRTYNTSLVFDRDGRARRHLPQDPSVRRGDPRPGLLPGVRALWRRATRPVVADGRRRPGRPVDLLRPAVPGAVPAAAPIDGAKVLVVPAAFMMHTGRDHWEVLLRARAIENQCYVRRRRSDRRPRPGPDLLRPQHDHRPVGDGDRPGPGRHGVVVGRPRPRPAGDDPHRAAEPGERGSASVSSARGAAGVTSSARGSSSDGQHRRPRRRRTGGAAHPGWSAQEQAMDRDDHRDQHKYADHATARAARAGRATRRRRARRKRP